MVLRLHGQAVLDPAVLSPQAMPLPGSAFTPELISFYVKYVKGMIMVM